MTTKIYAVRHGETDWNKASIMQGEADIPLNETGIAQAHALAGKLEKLHFDIVYCSSLERARQTCELGLRKNKYKGKIIFDDRIRERVYGEFNGKTAEQIGNLDFVSDFWDINKNQSFIKAENVFQFEKRIFGFLEDIKQKHAGKNVLVVAHAGVLRMIGIYVNGAPADGKYRKSSFDNAGVVEFII